MDADCGAESVGRLIYGASVNSICAGTVRGSSLNGSLSLSVMSVQLVFDRNLHDGLSKVTHSR